MSDNQGSDDLPTNSALVIDNGFAALNNFEVKDGKKISNDPIPRYKFASFANALSMSCKTQKESFLKDCSIVFTARTMEESDSYSTGETFFLPCLMKPRCALEALAHDIFYAHVNGLKDNTSNKDEDKSLLYDPERSGAEWWTLVLDVSSEENQDDTKQKESEDEAEVDDEVGMHFDADYGLESQMAGISETPNFLLHPRVATITYLSDVGVPTLILDKQSPTPSDVELKSLSGNIQKAWISHPKFGKHVAFDGRLLHGAPGEFFPGVLESIEEVSEPEAKRVKLEAKSKQNPFSKKRITFLVNIWLNHCPLDADLLDDSVVSKLTTPWEDQTETTLKADESYMAPFHYDIQDAKNPDDMGESLKLTKAPTDSEGAAGVEEDLVICHRHIKLNFGATMKDFHYASNLAARKGSAELIMGEGVLSLEVGEVASSDEEDEE